MRRLIEWKKAEWIEKMRYVVDGWGEEEWNRRKKIGM